MAQDSWILQLRDRLAEPPPKRLATGNGSGRTANQVVVVVPLYVESGELWTIFRQEHSEGLSLPSNTFPGEPSPDPDPWPTVAKLAQRSLGVVAERVLRLGELDEVEGPAGFQLRPCVIAIPVPEEPAEDSLRIPLTAIASPRLVEEQDLQIEGQIFPVTIYHVGRHRLWGPSLEMILNLWRRLGAS